MALPFPRPVSLSPAFTLSRCTPDDIPQMVSVYLAAFKETRFVYWWPESLEAMRRWNEARFHLRFMDPTYQQFKVVEEESGQVVAFSQWIVPVCMKGLAEGFKAYGKGDFNDPENETGSAPEGCNEELYREFFAGVRGMNQKWEATEKLDLGLLCTHPAFHRRGIGGALLQSVLAVADAEGMVTYLEGLSNAVAFYERYGFKTVDKLEYDLTKAEREGTAVIDIMLRAPKSSGQNPVQSFED
ncbi:acyl-CoA N-acyltransferase [Xylariales sp. AK1849]|nr:acyl-CoA N-acyltransferase [Xylariales sp. AK1849]